MRSQCRWLTGLLLTMLVTMVGIASASAQDDEALAYYRQFLREKGQDPRLRRDLADTQRRKERGECHKSGARPAVIVSSGGCASVW